MGASKSRVFVGGASWLFAAIAALAVACSGGDGTRDGAGGGGDGGSDGGANSGGLVLLEGPADQLAEDAVRDFAAGELVTADEITTDDLQREVVRTQLEIVFAATATVGDVNGVLRAHGASLVSSVRGVAALVVRIPDPASLAALDALVATIEAEPPVAFVMKVEMPQPRALPDPIQGDPSLHTYVDSLIAVRAPAAWNARAAMQQDPQVTVVDNFGGGAPSTEMFDIRNQGRETDFHRGDRPRRHGYEVLSVITARHGGERLPGTDAHALTTGMVPGTVELRVIDREYGYSSAAVDNAIIHSLNQTAGKVVLNTSYGPVCDADPDHCINRAQANRAGVLWQRKIRANDLEARVVHASALMNVEDIMWRGGVAIVSGPRDGETDSAYNSAALLAPLTDEAGHTVANLSNTLAVENVMRTKPPPYAPYCTSNLSFTGGNIGGIGIDVFVLKDTGATASRSLGTSIATPQVAGLAAYLLALQPDLAAPRVVDIIQATARPMTTVADTSACSDAATHAPIIDAYEAVLALDSGTSPAQARIRQAILDVAGDDGTFDASDLKAFVAAFEAADPAAPDYSRFDLNGDGYTGAPERTGPFNLDADPSRAFGSVTQTIEDTDVTFDETAVSDWQVLCYYAYSPLFAGSAAARTSALTGHLDKCGAGPAPLPCAFPQEVPTPIRLLFACDIENAACRLFAPADTVSPRCGDTDAIDVMFDRNDLSPSESSLTTGSGWTVVASSPGLVPGGFDNQVRALPADTTITTTLADATGRQYALVYRFNPAAGSTTILSFSPL